MPERLASQTLAINQFPDRYPQVIGDQTELTHELHNNMVDLDSTFPGTSQSFDRVISQLDRFTDSSLKGKLGSSDLDTGSHKRNEGVDSELPIDTVAIMGNVYSLTGARVVKTDTSHNGYQTEVLREGMYDGKVVYFSEYYTASDFPGSTHTGKPGFNWVIHSKEVGDKIVNEATAEQRAEYEQITGQHFPQEAQVLGINKVTYLDHANRIAGLNEAKKIAAEEKRESERRHEKRLSLQTTKKVLESLIEDEGVFGADDTENGMNRELMAENIALRNQQYAAAHSIKKHNETISGTTGYKTGTGSVYDDITRTAHRAARRVQRQKLDKANKQSENLFRANEAAFMEEALKEDTKYSEEG